MKKFWRLLMDVLREIGDENAYTRFLSARGLQPSRENWRTFSDDRHDLKYQKPKCC